MTTSFGRTCSLSSLSHSGVPWVVRRPLLITSESTTCALILMHHSLNLKPIYYFLMDRHIESIKNRFILFGCGTNTNKKINHSQEMMYIIQNHSPIFKPRNTLLDLLSLLFTDSCLPTLIVVLLPIFEFHTNMKHKTEGLNIKMKVPIMFYFVS